MNRWLLNSAVITAAGTWTYEIIQEEDARVWLRRHAPDGLVSRIGYDATADRVAELAGIPSWRPTISREASVLEVGDEALVVRLPYRVPDPAAKATHAPQAWEYGILRRVGGPT
jgi:hypothetical protein